MMCTMRRMGWWVLGVLVAAEAGAAQVGDTRFFPDRGFYTNDVQVTVRCDTPGALISVTTDGSDPQAAGGQVSPVVVDTVFAPEGAGALLRFYDVITSVRYDDRSPWPLVDAVDVFNPVGGPVDLDGWWLTDDRKQPRKSRIPPTLLAAAARTVSTLMRKRDASSPPTAVQKQTQRNSRNDWYFDRIDRTVAFALGAFICENARSHGWA